MVSSFFLYSTMKDIKPELSYAKRNKHSINVIFYVAGEKKYCPLVIANSLLTDTPIGYMIDTLKGGCLYGKAMLLSLP